MKGKIKSRKEKESEENRVQYMGENNKPEPTIDSKLELIKHSLSVHSSISKNIKADFLLSYLDEKDKQLVIEMVHNADFVNRIYDTLIDNGYSYKYNNGEWERVGVSKEVANKLNNLKKKTYEAYLTKIYMINIMNRNKHDNPVFGFIANIRDEEHKEDEEGFKAKLKKLVEPQDQEQMQ